MFVSIIVPVHNSFGTLCRHLDSIMCSTYKDYELILVDDGSQEDYREVLKRYPVVYKRLGQRRGSYYARNVGAEDARGDILVFLDADIVIRSDTLEKIVDIFSQSPDISALIGSYDDDPGAHDTISQFKFLCHHYIHQHERQYVGSFWTGCGAIRSKVFNELGGFNLNLFSSLNSVNDVDLGYRLKERGILVYNARHIQVKHLKKLNLLEWIRTDIFVRGLPWMKILWMHKDFSRTLNINHRTMVSLVSAWLMFLFAAVCLWIHGAVWILGFLAALFLGTNYNLLKFLGQKRGCPFLLACVPLLFIYYFNCGLCVLLFPFFRRRI